MKELRYIFNNKISVNLADIGRRKTAVFIKTSDTEHNLDNLVSLFYTQTLQALCREADNSLKAGFQCLCI